MSNGTDHDPAVSVQPAGSGIDLNRILFFVLFALVTGNGAFSVSQTSDRYTGADAERDNEHQREILSRIERKVDAVEDRVTGHLDTHPDRGLQSQISETRQELIRLEALHKAGER